MKSKIIIIYEIWSKLEWQEKWENKKNALTVLTAYRGEKKNTFTRRGDNYVLAILLNLAGYSDQIF